MVARTIVQNGAAKQSSRSPCRDNLVILARITHTRGRLEDSLINTLPAPTPAPPTPSRAVEAFTMHLGLALHRYGTPAHRLEEAMGQVARRFGVPSHFLSTPTSITASFGAGDGQSIYMARADQGEMNLAKLSLLDQLSTEVILGAVGPAEAYQRVDTIVAAPPPYGPALMALAYGAASGAMARLFGGGWLEIAVATIIGLSIGVLAVVASHFPTLGRIFDMTGAMVAALLGAAAVWLIGPFSLHTASLAGIIILIPGLTLTTAMTELATGNLVSGTARMMGAATTFLKLGFGAALGTHVGASLFHIGLVEPPVTAAPWTQWPAAALAALALSVVLQAEPREFGWILLTSLLGLAGTHIGGWLVGAELGPFVAALMVTLGSNVYARWCNRAATITQVPAILLLVPGSVGYRSMAALLERNVVSGMEIAFTMALTAMALVAGVLLANVLLPPRRIL